MNVIYLTINYAVHTTCISAIIYQTQSLSKINAVKLLINLLLKL
jgi:hypothetical protein